MNITLMTEAFKFIDAEDWHYLEKILIDNLKGQHDSQTRIWIHAMRLVKEATLSKD